MNRVMLVSILLTFVLIGSLVPMTVAAQDNEPLDEGMMDCVDVAIEDGSFTVLIEAVQAAGLEDTFRGMGPYTIFAPTDDAFAELLAELGITEEELLTHPDLEEILLYHVVDDVLMEADLVELDAATTLEGSDVEINVHEVNGGEITINHAWVMETDVECSNGVIHVIDQVLMPPEPCPPGQLRPGLPGQLPPGQLPPGVLPPLTPGPGNVTPGNVTGNETPTVSPTPPVSPPPVSPPPVSPPPVVVTPPPVEQVPPIEILPEQLPPEQALPEQELPELP